jgi:hypothetical protein
MRRLKVSIVVATLTAIVAFTGASHARCVLPVPDGGGEPPSPANVEGDIVSIKGDVVAIRSLRTKKEVLVRVPMNKPIYSAFGGDDDPRELRPGQRAWVWFVDCKRGKQAIPESAYFQIYSKDPNDRP